MFCVSTTENTFYVSKGFMEEIINIKDMELIFETTDSLGIDREALNVDLGKEDPGQWSIGTGGMMKKNTINITIPLSVDLEEWLPVLKAGLIDLLGDLDE